MGPCVSASGSDESNPLKNLKIQINSHTLLLNDRIAAGAYGDIYKCKDIKSNQIFALKQIRLQNKQLSNMYNKQSQWLAKLTDCPGVIKYIGHKVITNDNTKHDRRQSDIGVIVTQFYQISLFDLIKNRRFSLSQIKQFIIQAATTLAQIHAKSCLHLDIKLENILCKNKQNNAIQYFLCDFGSCFQGSTINVQGLSKPQKSKLKQQIQSNSTLIYRAPQMIELNKEPINSKTDIWMLGCVLYVLLYRKHPFEGQGELGIVTASVVFPDQFQLDNSQDYKQHEKEVLKIKDCLKGMLKKNPNQRISENQLISKIK